MCWSSGYNIRSTHAPSKWQGGISLFWRSSETYEIIEVELGRPNVLLFQLSLGAMKWYIIGCYIPQTNPTTLTHVEQDLDGMPKRLPPYSTRQSEHQPCCPEQQTRLHDCQTGAHGASRHVQPFLSMSWEKIPGAMDVADEEREEMDLFPV